MRQQNIGVALFVLLTAAASAQENSNNIISVLRDRAVVLEMVARVVEKDQASSWNSASSKVTIPGRPVSMKLVGSNVIVAVQFTPYKREDGRHVLVAQGQVWVSTKEDGMRYYTSMQTIPIEFGESVYFFPLGQKKSDAGSRIEVQLKLSPYEEKNEQTPPNTDPESSNTTDGERKAGE